MGKVFSWDGRRCCDNCSADPRDLGMTRFGPPIIYKGCAYYVCPTCRELIKEAKDVAVDR